MFLVIYSLIPWIGVMAAGYAFGRVYTWEAPRRKRFLLSLGAAMCAAFVVLRAINGYGDPAPFAAQDDPLFTVISFLNTTKYPPSLMYLLMTLGPGVVLLGVLEGSRGGGILDTYGRVPLFFYLLQWPLAHLAAVIVALLNGVPVGPHIASPLSREGAVRDAFPLWATHVSWIVILLILYPLCRWYAGVKSRHRDRWWLSYL